MQAAVSVAEPPPPAVHQIT